MGIAPSFCCNVEIYFLYHVHNKHGYVKKNTADLLQEKTSFLHHFKLFVYNAFKDKLT